MKPPFFYARNLESLFFLLGVIMRLCRYSWPSRLIIYCFCASFVIITTPRPARAAFPLLYAPLAVSAPVLAEIYAVALGWAASMVAPVAAGVAVSATVVGVGVALDRRTPRSVGNSLRASGVPVAGVSMLEAGIVSASDFDMAYNDGQMKNVTSQAELVALKASGPAASYYSEPSKFNPVPVYIPPLPSFHYPSVSESTMISSFANGVYNIRQGGKWLISDSADNLQSWFINDDKDRIESQLNKIAEDYVNFFDERQYCLQNMIRESYPFTDIYTVKSLDSFSYPAVKSQVLNSAQKGTFIINGKRKTLPLSTYLNRYIEAFAFQCVYEVARYKYYGMDKEVFISHNGYSVVFSGREYYLGAHTVTPSSSLAEQDNTSPTESVIMMPLPMNQLLLEELSRSALSASQIAAMINVAWRDAAAVPGYAGIDWPGVSVVTPAMIQEIIDARGLSPSKADLLSPVSDSGRWDIPIYNITLNQYVSITYVEAVPDIDFGEFPDNPLPELPLVLPIDRILFPITDNLNFMKDFKLRARSATCPIFSFNVFNHDYTFREHCTLLNQSQSIISLFSIIAWTILSLFIVIRGRK